MVTPTLAQVYFGVQGQGMASALLIVSPYQNLALSSFLGDKGNILHREQRTEFLWDCVQCEILPVTTESRRALQIYSKIYIFFYRIPASAWALPRCGCPVCSSADAQPRKEMISCCWNWSFQLLYWRAEIPSPPAEGGGSVGEMLCFKEITQNNPKLILCACPTL